MQDERREPALCRAGTHVEGHGAAILPHEQSRGVSGSIGVFAQIHRLRHGSPQAPEKAAPPRAPDEQGAARIQVKLFHLLVTLLMPLYLSFLIYKMGTLITLSSWIFNLIK